MTGTAMMKRALIASMLTTITLVGAAGYFALQAKSATPNRHDLGIVLMMFLELRDELESDVAFRDGSISTEAIFEKWSAIQKRTQSPPVDFYVSQEKGLTLVVKDFRTAIVLNRVGGQKMAWSCMTYPELAYNSLCTQMNQRR